MKPLLHAKNAFITGTNRGIGKAMAQNFAQHGANLWLHARQETAEFSAFCESLAAEHGVWVKPVYFDLSDETQIKAALRAVVMERIPVDVLVNNAGMTSPNALFQMTPVDTMRRIMEVNFIAPMLITQLILRAIPRTGGSIINIASIAGIDGVAGQLEYCASKAALAAATKKLSHELKAQGLRVNAIAPGLTETDMLHNMSAEMGRDILGANGQIATPQSVAELCLFLASDLSTQLTGQVLRTDGK